MRTGGHALKVEQYVMAYQVEQDRLRAFLPEGFESLRPVLRINAEIRDGQCAYLEFNTAAQCGGVRGWLNIGHWDSETADISFAREGNTVTFITPLLRITYTAIGMEGNCPAEKDNQGCFFLDRVPALQRPEQILVKKEFCDCSFMWNLPDGAQGISQGKTLPAFYEEPQTAYEKQPLCAETAAVIPCKQVLGAYVVRFDR